MKRKIFKFILHNVLRWKIVGEPSDKSVCAVAPHTSYLDGVIGYIALMSIGVNFKVISAEWLFFWPFKYIMKYVLHARPCGPHSGNTITASVNALNETEKCNLVICPEGHLKAVEKFNKGFWIIAKKANVDIDVVTFNYQTKHIFIDKYDISNMAYDEMICYMRRIYTDKAGAKYPNKFKIPEISIN